MAVVCELTGCQGRHENLGYCNNNHNNHNTSAAVDKIDTHAKEEEKKQKMRIKTRQGRHESAFVSTLMCRYCTTIGNKTSLTIFWRRVLMPSRLAWRVALMLKENEMQKP